MKRTKILAGLLLLVASHAFATDYFFRTAVPGVRSSAPTVAACTPGTNVFAYTGTAQSFAVPSGCTQMQVVGWGAGGSGSSINGGVGGSGAFLGATFAVQGGQQYTIIVGRGGVAATAGGAPASYGGGAAGGGEPLYFLNAGSGAGGGGSFVQLAGQDIFAAGGGGGGGWGGQNPGPSYWSYAGGNALAQGGTGSLSTSDSGTGPGGGGGGGGHNGGLGGTLSVGSYYAFEYGGSGGASYAAPSATNVSSTAGSATTAPNTSSADYATGIAAGGAASRAGGNGRVVIHYQ